MLIVLIDFTEKSENELQFISTLLHSFEQQDFIRISALHLFGAKTLTDAQFSELISHFPNLRSIHLKLCAKLGKDSLIALARYCPHLQVIKLERLATLQKVTSFFSARKHYPLLTKLVVTNCEKLVAIDIIAPQLKSLCIHDNPKLKTVRTQSLSLISLSLAHSNTIDGVEFKNIVSDWSKLKKLDISGCTKIQLNQTDVLPIIRDKLTRLRVQNCSVSEYDHYLSHPAAANLLAVAELEFYLRQLIKSQSLQLKHLPLDDASHWLLRLLSEASEDLQSTFLRYILARYAQDSPELEAVYRWLAKCVTSNLFTVLDFSQISCIYTQEPAAHDLKHLCPQKNSNLFVLSDDLLVSASGTSLEIWDLQTGQSKATLHWNEHDTVTSLAILPDEQLAVGTNYGVIKLWDLQTKQCTATLIGPMVVEVLELTPAPFFGHTEGSPTSVYRPIPSRIDQLTVLPNKLLASTLAMEGSIRLWDCTMQRNILTLSSYAHSITSSTLLPSGHLASGSINGTIKFWNTTTGQCIATLGKFSFFTRHRMQALVVLPNDRIASILDNTIKIWSIQTKQCMGTFQLDSADEGLVNSVTVLPNGQLASRSNRSIIVWDPETYHHINTYNYNASSAPLTTFKTPITTLPDGQLLNCDNSYTFYRWSFPRIMTRLNAKLIANALLFSSSVTKLAGTEFIDDTQLRVLIELRIKRNLLFQRERLTRPDYTLTQAAIEVGDSEAVEALSSHSEALVLLPPRTRVPSKNLTLCRGASGIFSLLRSQYTVTQSGVHRIEDCFSNDTLGDGNCAFNAFALGLARIILENRSLILPQRFILPFSHRGQDRMPALRQWINKNKNDKLKIQKDLAPALRQLAIKIIELNYDACFATNFIEQLENAFQHYTPNQQPDNTQLFLSQPYVLAAMQRTSEITDLIHWWNEEGKERYFSEMKQDAQGKAFRYGGDLELTILAQLFGITIQYDATQPQRVGVLYGECVNLSEEDFKLLHTLEITEEHRGTRNQRIKSYFCKANIEEIQYILMDLPELLLIKVDEHITTVFDGTQWSANEKEHLIRRNCIRDGLWLMDHDGVIDHEEIKFRLRNISLEAKTTILNAHRPDIPIIIIGHQETPILHWQYLGLGVAPPTVEEALERNIALER